MKLHNNNHFTFYYRLDLKNALKSKELGSKGNRLDPQQIFTAQQCQIRQPKIKVSTFSYSNSSNTTIIKKLCKSKKLVKSQSGHTEKPFADH